MNVKDHPEIFTNKKANAEYWDEIDHTTESYVSELLKFSTKEIKLTGLSYNEDGTIKNTSDIEAAKEYTALEIGKDITEFAVKLLKEKYDAEFPYVDENL